MLEGTKLRGQTPICGFLRFPAQICGFLRKSAVFCENLRFPNALFSRKRRESAKISENLRLGSVRPLERGLNFEMGNIPVTTTTKIFPKVLQYKWEAYCNTNGGRTVIQMGGAECTAVAAIRLRMRMRILTRPENSLANFGRQISKRKLRIKRCEGIH